MKQSGERDATSFRNRAMLDRTLVMVAILCFAIPLMGCGANEAKSETSAVPRQGDEIVSRSLSATPTSNSSVPASLYNSSVPDFNNFVYPWIPAKYKEHFGLRRSIALSNGRIIKRESDEVDQYDVGVDVYFADLTGDKRDEAIVNLSVLLPNRAMPSCIFVYDLGRKNPLLLWTYESGRGDVKGFKDIDFADGCIIVEEFILKDALTCCPKSYYRTVFCLDGASFRLEKDEILPFNEPNRPF